MAMLVLIALEVKRKTIAKKSGKRSLEMQVQGSIAEGVKEDQTTVTQF